MTNFAGSSAKIGEFRLIEALAAALPTGDKDVFLGIGDDAAAVDIGNDRLLLATCDIQIENVHFTISGFTPEQIGIKAAAVNLSDIAAMGGVPRFALVSIAVPAAVDAAYIGLVYRGLGDFLFSRGATVIGGNTSKSEGGLIIDVTLLGEVEKSRLLTRNGARPGDALCVTGSLGASRAGLMLLSNADLFVSEKTRNEALTRHRTPCPRLSEIRAPSALGGITSCIDISDGLRGDAGHLADRSGVKVIIDIDELPVAPCAREVAALAGENHRRFALQGGEDFELLFTAPNDRVDAICADIAEKTKTPVTVIGEIARGKGVWIRRRGSLEESMSGGFDHLS